MKTTTSTSTRTIYHRIAVGSYLQYRMNTHTRIQASTQARTSRTERTRRQPEDPERYRILPPSTEDMAKGKDDGMHRSSLFFAFANHSRHQTIPIFILRSKLLEIHHRWTVHQFVRLRCMNIRTRALIYIYINIELIRRPGAEEIIIMVLLMRTNF